MTKKIQAALTLRIFMSVYFPSRLHKYSQISSKASDTIPAAWNLYLYVTDQGRERVANNGCNLEGFDLGHYHKVRQFKDN